MNYEAPARTSNGGKSWVPWTDLPDTAFSRFDHMRDLAITGNGVVFLVGAGGTVVKGRIGDPDPWTKTQMGTPSTLLAVDFPTEDTGYAAGESGDILRTLDGGATWTLGGTGTPETLTGVHLVDSETAYAVGGALIRTRDGGITWQHVPMPTGTINDGERDIGDGLFYDGRQITASPGLTAFNSIDCLCLQTRPDASSPWKEHVFTGHIGKVTAYASDGTGFLYAVGGSDFHRIDPRGESWEFQTLETGRELRGLHCPEIGTCYAVGDQGVILKLTIP